MLVPPMSAYLTKNSPKLLDNSRLPPLPLPCERSQVDFLVPTVGSNTEAQVLSPRIKTARPAMQVATPMRPPRAPQTARGPRSFGNIAPKKGSFVFTSGDLKYSWQPSWRRADAPFANHPPEIVHRVAAECDVEYFPMFPKGPCPERQTHLFRGSATQGDASSTARSGLPSPRGARRNGLWLSTAHVY